VPRFVHQIGAFALTASWLASAAAAAPPGDAAPALSAGSIIQLVAGLAVVLALVVAAARLLQRFSALRGTGSGLIRIIGGAAVGQRERVVLVEFGDTWLLLGVASGQVRALHAMPRAQSAPAVGATAIAPAVPDTGFPAWLRRMTEKRDRA